MMDVQSLHDLTMMSFNRLGAYLQVLRDLSGGVSLRDQSKEIRGLSVPRERRIARASSVAGRNRCKLCSGESTGVATNCMPARSSSAVISSDVDHQAVSSA
jgi:hypothetical protein